MSLRRKPLFVIIFVKHHVVFTKSRSERGCDITHFRQVNICIGDIHSFCSRVLACFGEDGWCSRVGSGEPMQEMRLLRAGYTEILSVSLRFIEFDCPFNGM